MFDLCTERVHGLDFVSAWEDVGVVPVRVRFPPFSHLGK